MACSLERQVEGKPPALGGTGQPDGRGELLLFDGDDALPRELQAGQ